MLGFQGLWEAGLAKGAVGESLVNEATGGRGRLDDRLWWVGANRHKVATLFEKYALPATVMRGVLHEGFVSLARKNKNGSIKQCIFLQPRAAEGEHLE